MKKIGIITIYHKNYNYGGQLQAYALTQYLSDCGFKVEQIDFDRMGGKGFLLEKLIVFIKWPISKKMGFIKNHFSRWKSSTDEGNDNIQYKNTIKKFDSFMLEIPHSRTYNRGNIVNVNNIYDYFVTGSDQVWNLDYCTKEYFLNFVKDKSKCMSYAASMQNLSISNKSRKMIKEYIENFQGISVREKGACDLLREIGIKKAKIVVDPVMLISKEKWLSISITPNIKEKYIFAYLIQREKTERSNECAELAKRLGYKLICITSPGWESDLSSNAKGVVSGTGPKEFLGLINNAEIIITDSFHAAAFSIIFNKQFYTYGVDDRKKTLLGRFGLENQMIKDGELIKKYSDKKLPYNDINKQMEEYVSSSKEYIYESLKEMEKR